MHIFEIWVQSFIFSYQMAQDGWLSDTCKVPYYIIACFLALVTTMVTKVDHGNYGWLPRLVTMVSYLGY